MNEPGIQLIDSHAHVDFPTLDRDRAEVVERARTQGVVGVVNPGVGPDSSRRALALAETYPGFVHAAVGLHPMNAGGDQRRALADLADLVGNPSVVAVGETGIDCFKKYHPVAEQRACFAAQLALALSWKLPIIIHCRDAFREVEEVFRAEGLDQVHGVMHCFSGTAADAEPFLERGMFLGIAGNVTYPRATALRDAVGHLPLDRLVVETDCPYLPPQKHRGERNEPGYVRATAEMVAALKGMSLADVARTTTENVRRLFPGVAQ
jgi:TatD DNase family protein